MLKKYIAAASFICCFFTQVTAQNSPGIYYMNSIPQVNYMNPAMLPRSKVNIGFPIVSGMYLGLSNSGFSYNDIITRRADDSLVIDMNNLVSRLAAKNYLNANLQADLLNINFRAGKSFIGIYANERISSNLVYPKALFAFINEGNGKSLLGQRADFDGFGLNFSHYREYALTFARQFMEEKLTIGVRGKYLNGFENLTTTSKLGLTSDQNTYDLTIDGGLTINSSGINALSNGTLDYKKYINNNNKGGAIDLGANYQFKEKISFSAALNDIGFINWKDDIRNIKNEDFNFKYTGVDIKDLLNRDSSFTSNLIDSIKNTATVKENNDAYRQFLNPKLILGSAFHLNRSNTAGVIVTTEFVNRSIMPGLTLSYNTRLWNFLSASLSYSILNRSYNNVGAGFSLNFFGLQFYMVSDNLLPLMQLASITPKGSAVAIPIPYKAQNLNLRFGFNITMGRPKNGKDKDKDGVVDKKDECPDVKGLVQLKGCPDKDGDGLADKNDSCPDVKGLIELKGCPDKDNDGIADQSDLCPDEKGDTSNNGCPLVKIHLINADNNILKTGIKNKDGNFVFDTLAIIDNAKFKLEKDVDSIKVVSLVFGSEIKNAKRNESGFYQFEKMNVDTTAQTPVIEVKEVEVHLEKEEEELIKNVFSHLEFDSGKEIILQSSFPYLQELADFMNKHNNWRIKLSGHTDNSGTEEANLLLSQKRVESVKNALVVLGINQSRIVLKWFGSSNPLSDNNSEEGRQKNRRVEMTIIE